MPEDYGWELIEVDDDTNCNFVQMLFKHKLRNDEVAIDFWDDGSNGINFVFCSSTENDPIDGIVSLDIYEVVAFHDFARLIGDANRAIAYGLEHDFYIFNKEGALHGKGNTCDNGEREDG